MSPNARLQNESSKSHHHQLIVRQGRDRGNSLFELYCKTLGRRDPNCKRKDDDPPKGNPPQNPSPQQPPPAPAPAPAPTTSTQRPPSPPSTTTSRAPAPAPPAVTQSTRPASSPSPSRNPTTSSRPSTASPEENNSETPRPAQSSNGQTGETSAETSQPTALPALSSADGTASGHVSSLISGTPTTSIFTSTEVITSDGVAYTRTSTGATVITVPGPTDLDVGQGVPTGRAVGASAKSTNVGAIVGGVLGALALLVLCAFAFLLYQRRKRKRTAPSSEFLRRYGNTGLGTPHDSNSPYASNVDVSQVRQSPEYTHANGSYHQFPYLTEKRVERD